MSEPRPDRSLKFIAAAVALGAPLLAWLLGGTVGLRGQAAAGALSFVAICALFSTNLRAVNWRTVGWGMAIQLGLAFLILKFEIGGTRPIYAFFATLADVVKRFLEFTNAGSFFVFGPLANGEILGRAFGPANGFVFAFAALPTIIFISSFFTVLYHFGVLQFIVWLMARAMMFAMRTSGAETLAAAANVFMGQTEAPIIVKPYVPGMTKSELLAMMVGGMATISGGVMAVYIGLGADPIAILTTSVMAAPCGLYLSKLVLPETEEPATGGRISLSVERHHVNVIDAAAGGASDGLTLALNVAAMLIAFLAFIALVDALLGWAWTGLTLARVFSTLFAPVAFLMGVPPADVAPLADLLGTKLVANEFVAFVKLTNDYQQVLSRARLHPGDLRAHRVRQSGSIGIQLGGIGGMAPTRRGDLARLGGRALLAGFLATLVNACVASMLL